MTAITVGTKTYTDATELVTDHPDLLVHHEQLDAFITSAAQAPAGLNDVEDVLQWLNANPAQGTPDEIYVRRMRNLVDRLKQQPLAELARLQGADLPGLFQNVLSVRFGMLKALDDYLRPLTAGVKTTEKFKAPIPVAAGLLLLEETYTQLTNIIRRYVSASTPIAAPVLGATDTTEATRLWDEYLAGRVIVFRNVRAAIGALQGISEKARGAMLTLSPPTGSAIADLLTRVAILLHFTPTRQALGAIEARVQTGGRLIVMGGSQETLAMLPGDAQTEATPLWKGQGWHTGLVVGQEKDATKLVPAGRVVPTATATALVPDITSGTWNGYTLATREIILAHELNHIQRQVTGGWGPGIPAGSPTEVRSAFQVGEEYAAVLTGEQPLRALIGLQPRGHISTSIPVVNELRKGTVTELEQHLT
ncbi:hypothetical protein OG417_51765 [Actinoallomurus sp. NBC_01490]|uniref:hypothetical protein n=1 Tax=Actinoallomurus sp. NBC_01490 TaxID=2903557 RepID=UPI002E36D3C8|nr:hypothetical protein [Actinoallomurus sp. NBC_01490]